MARYGVSRATVRQALGGLIADGLLEIRRGLGTYVRARPVEHALGGFYTFSREIERHGMAPGHAGAGRAASSRRTTTWRAELGLAAGDAVVALVASAARRRRARWSPRRSYLPAARFPGLEDSTSAA